MFYVIKEHNIKKISIFSENDSLMKVINVEEHAYHNMDSVLETEYDTTSACSIA
jgi:L-rhamnose mutarotase